jgi:hypothetical protein
MAKHALEIFLTPIGPHALVIKQQAPPDGRDIFVLNEAFHSQVNRLQINKVPKSLKAREEESK